MEDTNASSVRLPQAMCDRRQQLEWAPPTWMGDVCEAILHKPYCHLRLLGSHNSGSYAITKDSPFSSQAPGIFSRSGVKVLARSMLAKVCADWAKTQSLNILQQLLGGVRYYDLRIVWERARDSFSGRWWIMHTLHSVPLSDAIRDIATFYLSDASRAAEVITLDFQHVYCRADDKGPATASLLADLDPIAPLLIDPRRLNMHSTMKAIWANPCRIFAVFPQYVCDWFDARCASLHSREGSVYSVWHNCNSKQQLLALLTLQSTGADCVPEAASHRLSVMQAVLTIRGGDVVAGVMPNAQRFTVADLAEEVNSDSLKCFAMAHLQKQPAPGVLMLDFVERGSCSVALPQPQNTQVMMAPIQLCVMLNFVA